jgi:NhaA family Na+:H+ antiporter
MKQRKLLTPFQKFEKIESLGGVLLFCATVIALLWANSPYSEAYENLWNYKIGFGTQDLELTKPLILWVNDGLMAIFFFLIGLEIKRELVIGELNSLRKAAFPIVAAIGGIAIPVILFFILNNDTAGNRGWGIPMATDIAFSLAVLKLLGKKVPVSLKIFLTAFAIVDDLGAVLTIALFYTSGVKWIYIIYACIPLIILYYFMFRDIYLKYLIIIFGFVIWFLFLKSGIHPTIAGILLAFAIPIRQKIDINRYIFQLSAIIDKIKASPDPDKPILSKKQIQHIDDLEDWTNLVQSPLQHLEHQLHNWVAFFIMPVFALANTGIVLGNDLNLDFGFACIIALSMIIGKGIGITLFSYLSISSR